MDSTEFKTGFIGIVGPTNAGKSTLLNALLGKKLSIVSKKVQTTYHGIRGIVTTPTDQMIFIDTPGFQKHPTSIARMLNQVAEQHGLSADMAVWVFDVSQKNVERDVENWKQLITAMKPPTHSILVLNKVDLASKPSLLPLMQKFTDLNLFSTIIPISAEKKDGIENLRSVLKTMLPEGPKMYDDHLSTDRPDSFVITEMIREKIYHLTYQEIPYTVRVIVEEVPEMFQTKTPSFFVKILVDASSRRGILIGKQGRILKQIGIRAREDIQKWLGYKICLKMQIDIEPEWRSNKATVQSYLELS